MEAERLRQQVTDLQTKLAAFEGKSAVPIAALKNFAAIAVGVPDDAKDVITALKALTGLPTKEATVLWEEIRTAALKDRHVIPNRKKVA